MGTTRYGPYDPGIVIPVGAKFSTPIQTGPGADPASHTMNSGSFQGKSFRGVALTPTQCSAEFKERVELYLLFPSGPSWPVLG